VLDKFLQTLMDALAVGSLYALIALGYTMVYGILKFINFAHSDIFVLGAWVSYAAALCAGFTATGDAASPGVWVFWVVGILVGVATLFLLYERVVARGNAATRLSGTLTLVAGWAGALLLLVYVARGAKSAGAPSVLVGGLILILAMGTCGLVGFCLERMAYKPLRKAPRINVLITAIGVSLLLQNVGQLNWMFGTRPQSMPTLLQDRVLNRKVVASGTLDIGEKGLVLPAAVKFEEGRTYLVEAHLADGANRVLAVMSPPGEYKAGDAVTLNGTLPNAAAGPGGTGGKGATYQMVRLPRVPIRLVDVVGAGTAVLLMVVLDWLVFRTTTGRAMRAVSYHPGNAGLMGINVDKTVSITFVIGAALAAAAGFLFSQKYSGLNQTAAAIWVLLGLKAFVAAVVGGIGNIRGAMLGGILIGLLEFFGMAYVSTELRDLYVFSLLIVVLLVKPSGILGSTVREKV
jgi:branched-subunit amino acid ABC-type transport system permease component